MHIYVFEPRAERRGGLYLELENARLIPVPVEDDFFRGDLSLVTAEGADTRPFLLAAQPVTAEHVRRLRASGCQGPVLVLRDFRNSGDAARMLDAGADDDLVIPLKGAELVSRINSVNRRAFGHAAESVAIGEITAYFDGRDPEISDRTVNLSRREHAIFQHLALNAHRVVSKNAIYEAVYGLSEDQPFDKVIDVYVHKLRKKISANTESGHHYIETVHGRGYRIAPPVSVEVGSLAVTCAAPAPQLAEAG